MNKLHHVGLTAAFATLALGLAGCDSQAQKEVKQQADAIDKADEAKANLIDSIAATSSNAAAMHNEADAIRAQGEATKDRLKNEANHLDDKPKN